MKKTVHIILFLSCILPGFAQQADANEKQRYPFLQFNFHTGSFWTRSEYLEEQFRFPYKAYEARFGY